jgi:hypothetical protein
MRHLAIALATLAALALVACGGDDDDDVPAALADVCTEGAGAPGEDVVSVDEPGPGDEIQSPLRVRGEVESPDGEFLISVVDAEGEHIIDYPGIGGEPEVLSPFDQEVPFSVFEETPACLWVYLTDAPEPEDARRIPITLLPDATSTAEASP